MAAFVLISEYLAHMQEKKNSGLSYPLHYITYPTRAYANMFTLMAVRKTQDTVFLIVSEFPIFLHTVNL